MLYDNESISIDSTALDFHSLFFLFLWHHGLQNQMISDLAAAPEGVEVFFNSTGEIA